MKSLEYEYPVESLCTGSSLGNRFAFAQLDEMTNLKGLWSSSDNQFYLGEWNIDIITHGKVFTPTTTRFAPESQTTRLKDDSAGAEKQFFLPFALDGQSENRLRAGVFLVRLINSSSEKTTFIIRHSLTFPAVPSGKFTKKPPEQQAAKRMQVRWRGNMCEVATVGNPAEIRILSAQDEPSFKDSDEQSLRAEYRYELSEGEVLEVPFQVAFSPTGPGPAREAATNCSDAKEMLVWSRLHYADLLSRAHLFTPEPVINRGLQWAKVNTARVQHLYRIGEGFTNDPPQDIIVVRDLGWYVLGSDYLTPDFSRGLLRLAEQYAFHDNGKLTEFIHADEVNPEKHDYNLNINDDTPLYVYGLYHHAVAAADESFLERSYPLMQRACDHILTQMKDGLVHCYSEGTYVWGICSWRNIIDNYNLTGAVTEINAECCYALGLIAQVAAKLGHIDDAQRYGEASKALREAINKYLASEKTGMYLLNLDSHGNRHHDVTGDLIFPVMFGIADAEVGRSILTRLMTDEFWTPYGTRTVSPHEANYDPDFGYQLVGGVWPNLTAWTAYCVREWKPEKLVEGMLNTYRLAETEKPRDFVNVVPGEFPERLHGETFVSRGMTMSPWMPPTYLWLGIEGLMGVKPQLNGLEISPAIPPDWNWVAVKRMPYKGSFVTAFLLDGTLHSTQQVMSRYPVKTGTLVPTAGSHDHLFSIGMVENDELLLFVAADAPVKGIVTIEFFHSHVKQEVSLAAGEAKLYRLPITHGAEQTMKGIPV